MANILYEMSPLLGALEGKGTFGNLLGKADSLKAAKDAADKAEADKKTAFDKIASNGGRNAPQSGMRKGGAVKTYAKGGSVKSSASKRGDGIAQRGKTRGKIV